MKNIELSTICTFEKQNENFLYENGQAFYVLESELDYGRNVTKTQNEKMKLLEMIVSDIVIDGESAMRDPFVIFVSELPIIVIQFSTFTACIKPSDIFEDKIIEILYPNISKLISSQILETAFDSGKVESKLVSYSFPELEFERKWDVKDIETESTNNTNSGYKEIESMLNVHFLKK